MKKKKKQTHSQLVESAAKVLHIWLTSKAARKVKQVKLNTQLSNELLIHYIK